tara:strand:- start:5156 stop:5734 length:579 start_codon:yes stop_codon:yes gene_type:complete
MGFMNEKKHNESLTPTGTMDSHQIQSAQTSRCSSFLLEKTTMSENNQNTKPTEENTFDESNVSTILNVDLSALLTLDESHFDSDEERLAAQQMFMSCLKISSEMKEGKNGKFYIDLKTVKLKNPQYGNTHGIALWLKRGEDETEESYQKRVKKFKDFWLGKAKNYKFINTVKKVVNKLNKTDMKKVLKKMMS